MLGFAAVLDLGGDVAGFRDLAGFGEGFAEGLELVHGERGFFLAQIAHAFVGALFGGAHGGEPAGVFEGLAVVFETEAQAAGGGFPRAFSGPGIEAVGGGLAHAVGIAGARVGLGGAQRVRRSEAGEEIPCFFGAPRAPEGFGAQHGDAVEQERQILVEAGAQRQGFVGAAERQGRAWLAKSAAAVSRALRRAGRRRACRRRRGARHARAPRRASARTRRRAERRPPRRRGRWPSRPERDRRGWWWWLDGHSPTWRRRGTLRRPRVS